MKCCVDNNKNVDTSLNHIKHYQHTIKVRATNAAWIFYFCIFTFVICHMTNVNFCLYFKSQAWEWKLMIFSCLFLFVSFLEHFLLIYFMRLSGMIWILSGCEQNERFLIYFLSPFNNIALGQDMYLNNFSDYYVYFWKLFNSALQLVVFQ